jgi:ABC-2 type transport system permease protein
MTSATETATTAVAPTAARHRRSNASLLAMWTAQLLRQTIRNPQATFFTFAFPLLFLTLFSALNAGANVTVDTGKVAFAQFFTPGIATFGVITSCLSGLVISIAMERDGGILKRVRSSPLRPSVYIGARIASTVIMAFATVTVLFLVGVLAFGVDVYPRLLPAALVTMLLGTIAFCAIGMAIASVVPNGNAAPAIVNVIVLPMTFISGVFYPMTGAPQWLQAISNVLPLRHLVDAFGATFSPYTTGWGFAWNDLAVLAAWGVFGTVFAIRHFRWESAPERADGTFSRLFARRAHRTA